MTVTTVIILSIIAVFLLIAVGGLVAMLVITLPIADNVYHDTLTKDEDEKWGRACSAPENEEQMQMWNTGLEWADKYKSSIREISITNDGLKLFGEFFDFGSDRCAIILPGRCECLKYSYYFAKPYRDAGMNVLVIDQRAHGLSDGKYSTIGVKESEDLRAWIEYIEKAFSIKEIYIHGICVGCCSGLFLMEKDDCPSSVKGIVMEGCFTTFRETYKRHMIVDKRPLFPVLDLIMLKIKTHTGTNVLTSSPIKSLKHINQRVLFIFGKQDLFSIPVKSQLLFDKCKSPDKKIIWFEKGGHSHLRINNVDEYDRAIVEFVN